MGKRILVIAPHADDEAFGVGGTILKRVAAGDVAHHLIMTAADIKFEHTGGQVVTAQTRVDEARTVAEAMGVTVSFGIMGQESRLDALPLRDLVEVIERCQDDFKADVWYIPGPSFHQDHTAVYNACAAAGRPTRANLPKEVYKYELPTYSWNVRELAMVTNVYESIDDFMDRKLEVCGLYESQLRGDSNMLSMQQLQKWAEVRGFESHNGFAEAFEVVRIIR